MDMAKEKNTSAVHMFSLFLIYVAFSVLGGGGLG